MKVIPPKPFRDITKGPLTPEELKESVALEIESDSSEGKNLWITSSNRAVRVEKGRETVSLNKMDLAVSNKIEDNMIQNIDDLKVEFPEIEFDLYVGALVHENAQIEEITPNMAQAITQWLKFNEYKEGSKKIKKIMFNGDRNAGAFGPPFPPGQLFFGERAFDTSTLLERPIRGNTPLGIITHEHTHLQNIWIAQEEASKLVSASERLSTKYNQIVEETFKDFYESEDEEFKDFLEEVKIAKDKVTQYVLIKGATDEGKKSELIDEFKENFGETSFKEEYLSLSKEDLGKVFFALRKLPDERDFYLALDRGGKIEDLAGSLAELDGGLGISKDYLKHPIFSELYGKLEKITEKNFLLAPYAFAKQRDFSEVSTVYTEHKRDEVKNAIRQGDVLIRKATQLAYDSDKIDKQEYQYRMGNYCDTNPCGKCLIYTATCEE
jgi:hypothetical protein